tara:strand:- start:2528 stop:3010 length:483 start_codon:yes stop_codon:yes gene_type:complete
MATMTTTQRVCTVTTGDDAMECEDSHVDATTETIIVAAYRRDAKAVATALVNSSRQQTAEMSLSRAAAVSLLGEDVYLGSHSWSTQEDFPVMYFAGKNFRNTNARDTHTHNPGRAHIKKPVFFPAKVAFAASHGKRNVGVCAGWGGYRATRATIIRHVRG